MKFFQRNPKITPESLTPHDFNVPADVELLNTQPFSPQFFEQIKSSTNKDDYETLPFTNNTQLMIDIVRYSLLNVKKRHFFGNRVIEKELQHFQTPILEV